MWSLTDSDIYLQSAALAAVVSMLGLVVLALLGRGNAAQLLIRMIAVALLAIVVVLDAIPVFVSGVKAIFNWDTWSLQDPAWASAPFWPLLIDFFLSLTPLVLAVACVAWNWNRRPRPS